jgi:Pvc16 N-terminal domain
MINDYAIAVISEGIKQKLNNALIQLFNMHVDFTFTKPASPPPSDPTINIMMYQALINPSLRNNELIPQRQYVNHSNQVEEVQTIFVPLTLYYLLSFYGPEEKLVPQRLMAATVGVLHENPLISTDDLNTLLNTMEETKPSAAAGTDTSSGSIPIYTEPVKLSWSNITADDSFKLWSALQTPYASSIAYEANTAIIYCGEREQTYTQVKQNGAKTTAQPHLPNPRGKA